MPSVSSAFVPEAELTAPRSGARRLKRWRRLAQLVSVAVIGQWSFYGIFRCPFVVPYVSCQNCPVITCHGRILTMFWGFWLLLPLSVLVFGRAFCAWFCPGGLVNHLFGMIAPIKLRITNAFTRTLPALRYLGLAAALFVWLWWGQPREGVPIRVGPFFSSVALTFQHASALWLVRTFIVLGIAALGLLLANAWCRYACPTGGALEALKRFSWFKVYKDARCNDCNRCLQVCEMGTRPAEVNCTNCCDCRSVCPQDAIRIGRAKEQ